MDVTVDDKEIAMAILNAFTQFENHIVALDALENENKEFTLEYIKNRLLDKRKRAQKKESKGMKKCYVHAQCIRLWKYALIAALY